MHPRQPFQLPAHATAHIWQPTQWAALFSPKNLLCPCPLAQGAVGVGLPGQLAAHPGCLCRHRLVKSPGCVCSEPRSQCLHSQPEAQDVSKSLLLELAGWPGPAPVCSLTHPALCPASSSLCHLWKPRFSGLLSLLWVFCSCLCLFLPPVERDVSTVRLC